MVEEVRRFVAVGATTTVELPANPTTGYDWQVEFPPDLVRLESRAHVRSSELVGAGGTTTFTFRALAVGDATLRFRYLRVWEGTPIDERSVHLAIRG